MDYLAAVLTSAYTATPPAPLSPPYWYTMLHRWFNMLNPAALFRTYLSPPLALRTYTPILATPRRNSRAQLAHGGLTT